MQGQTTAPRKIWVFGVTQANWEILHQKNLWALRDKERIFTKKISKGDLLIFFVSKIRPFGFFGVYEVEGDWYEENKLLWADEQDEGKVIYPHRVTIRPVQLGFAEYDKLVPILQFVEFKEGNKKWVHLRGIPANLRRPIGEKDAQIIIDELKKNALVEIGKRVLKDWVEPPGVVVGKTAFDTEHLFKIYKGGKIHFNTEYQRSEVWARPRKRLLIDSILRGYDINKIFLREIGNGTFECLDGQQRLRSIFQFLDDGFTLDPSSMVGEASFSELPPKAQYKILYNKIDSVVVYQADDETTCDIFLRLQEGMPLNSPEKLNAVRGFTRNKVVEISTHKFMQKLGIPNSRFTHRYLCAQVALLEKNNPKITEEGPRIVDVKYRNIVDMYELGREKDLGIFGEMSKVLNFMDRSLGDDAKAIRDRTDFVPTYFLASYLMKRYAMSGRESDFHGFVLDFLSKSALMDPDVSKVADAERPFLDYRVARSKSTDTKRSIEGGFKVMLDRFLESYPELPLKDPQREFDYGQKLAIYTKYNGVCQDDKAKVPFDKAEFHHVKFWSKGGPTNVENGLLLCHTCHATRHSASPANE